MADEKIAGIHTNQEYLQKAGMLYEGLLRSKMFAKGKYWDVEMYAITKNDYTF